MPSGTYLGMTLSIADVDRPNAAFFRYCREHALHLQQCQDCRLLHYPPSANCPYCGSASDVWVPVEGTGIVHTYTEVHHATNPAFKPFAPYMIAVVELGAQVDRPAPHAALRIPGIVVNGDCSVAGRTVWERIGIGAAMRMTFVDVSEEIALPAWTLDETASDRPFWRAQA